MTTDETRSLLTIEEAAARLKISRGRCAQMAREGLLPGILHVGKRLVVDAATIDRLLQGDGGTIESPSEPE